MYSWHCHWPKEVWQISVKGQAKTKTKVVRSQHSKVTTAGPFHFLHMVPMSDVTML
jgi:hypothetical protein